jgi:endonuclease/exonuclease/phosphatase family metal-dependent hydrolase
VRPGSVTACPSPARDSEIRWVAWEEAADRVMLDAWCSAVGPALVELRGDSLPRVDSLVVVTWNTNLGAGNLELLIADLRVGTLTGGEPVEHFIVLLQETHRTGAAVPAQRPAASRSARRIARAPAAGERSGIDEVAERLGLSLFYVPSMRNGGGANDPAEDRGNAILTTLQLSDPTAIELPFEAQRRVAAAATLHFEANGRLWPLRVASVHLDHRSRAGRGLATLGPARTRQARAVAAALEAYPFAVVGGDLNSWSLPFLETAPRLLRELFPHMPAERTQATFIAGGVLPRHLDYLFLRAIEPHATAPVRVASRYGSDHHPVLAWIGFP